MRSLRPRNKQPKATSWISWLLHNIPVMILNNHTARAHSKKEKPCGRFKFELRISLDLHFYKNVTQMWPVTFLSPFQTWTITIWWTRVNGFWQFIVIFSVFVTYWKFDFLKNSFFVLYQLWKIMTEVDNFAEFSLTKTFRIHSIFNPHLYSFYFFSFCKRFYWLATDVWFTIYGFHWL